MKKYILIIVLINCSLSSKSQQIPLYNQFYFNPYILNPSYAAQNEQMESFITYRKQWTGINDSPVFSAINFQAPVGKNVALGINIYSDKSVLLTSNTIGTSFAYRVRFNSPKHYINFGLTAGIGLNNFDLSSIGDSNDPILGAALESTSYLVGQFGFNYNLEGLNIGFALPKLFKSKVNTENTFNEVAFEVLENYIGNISYKIPIGLNFSMTPMVLYRSIGVESQQYEALLLLKYKNIIWLGGSYRQDYGSTGHLGFKLNKYFKLNYSYEVAQQQTNSFTGGSHEIQLGIRFGKQRRESIIVSTPKVDDTNKSPIVEKLIIEPKKVGNKYITMAEYDSSPDLVIKITAPEIKKPVENVDLISSQKQDVDSSETELSGYYLVLGSFKNNDNANKFVNELKLGGIEAKILYGNKKYFYYVYSYYSASIDEAKAKVISIVNNTKFSKAWIYKL